MQVAVDGFVSGRLPPSLCRELGDAIEDDAQDALVGARCRQVQADLRFHLDHPRSDLMRRNRSVSNWATAKLERLGIAARKPHINQ